MAILGRTEEKNFSGKDLRGRSFRKEDLRGVKFTRANIQGVNFSEARLEGADFTLCEAGLTRRRTLLLYTLASLLLFSASLISLIINGILAFIFSSDIGSHIGMSLLMAAVFIFIGINYYKDILFSKNFTFGSYHMAINIAISFFFVALFLILSDNSQLLAIFAGGSVYSLISFPLNILSIAIPTSFIVALSGTWLSFILPIFTAVFFTIGSPLLLVLIISLLPLGGGGGDSFLPLAFWIIFMFSHSSMIFFSAFIAWQAFSETDKFSFIRSFAINFATFGGTNFQGAKLNNTNFSKANLKNTDFKDAKFYRTFWYQAEELHLARFSNSILTDRKVLNLLVEGEAKEGESYAKRNLSKANLKEFDLRGVDFEQADLTDASFEGARLEGANLTRVQALGTSFNKAYMTGAYIQEWNINSLTDLEYVSCDYIYLVKYPKKDPNNFEKCPSSGNFEKHQFTHLFREVTNTVDFILCNGVDWKAFTTAFRAVKVKYKNTELDIQNISFKGNNATVIKVKVPVNLSKEKIHKDLKKFYKKAYKLLENCEQKLENSNKALESYRREYCSGEGQVKLMESQHPISIPIEVMIKNVMSENEVNNRKNNSKVNITNSIKDNNSSSINLIQNSKKSQIESNQTFSHDDCNKTSLKELLIQLENEILQKDFSDEEVREFALEQVKFITESLSKPNNDNGSLQQKAINTAVKILKCTANALPKSAAMVTICNQLPDLIQKVF